MSSVPPPLVPAYVDLRSFTDIPVDAQRMVNSRAMRVIPDNAIRSWILLIYQSWSQLPAASLPDDDYELAHLAGFGRDVEAWQAIRDDALYGWLLCDDGRWYHPVVAEKALEAWQHKLRNRWYRLKPDEKQKFGGSFEAWIPVHEKELEKSADGVAKLPRGYRGVTAKPSRSPRDTNATTTRNVIGSELNGTERNGTDMKGSKGGVGEGAVAPARARNPDIDAAFDEWNLMAADTGLTKVQARKPERRKALAARLKEAGGLEGWKHACNAIRGSPFLIGQGNRGWRCNFDWAVKPGNFTKIMEGTYEDNDRQPRAHARIDDDLDAVAAALRATMDRPAGV